MRPLANDRTLTTESSSTLTITKYYYFNGQRVAERRGTTLYYLYGDHLGSTSQVTDSAGAGLGQQRYFPFGGIRYSTGTLPTDYGFTGQRLDAATGLMYYNARYYDPVLGRFIQADNIAPDLLNPQAFNRYSYVYNNPLRYNDPSGHQPQVLMLLLSNPWTWIALGIGGTLWVSYELNWSPNAEQNREALGELLFNPSSTVNQWASPLTGVKEDIAQIREAHQSRPDVSGPVRPLFEHMAKLLGEAVGGMPPPGDDDDREKRAREGNLTQREVDKWIKDMNKQLQELLKDYPERTTFEQMLQKRGFSGEQIVKIMDQMEQVYFRSFNAKELTRNAFMDLLQRLGITLP